MAVLLLVAALGGRAGVSTPGPLYIPSEADLYGKAKRFGAVDSTFVEGLRIENAVVGVGLQGTRLSTRTSARNGAWASFGVGKPRL